MRRHQGLLLAAGLGVALGSWAMEAAADTTAPAPPLSAGVEATHTVYTTPNPALMGSGLVLLGGPYIASVIVGATSGHPGDDKLYIPVVGPWLDYGERGGCPLGANCNAETGFKFLLAANGVAQGLGAVAVVASLFVPMHRAVPTRTTTGKPEKPHVHITPLSYAGGGGLAAFGSF